MKTNNINELIENLITDTDNWNRYSRESSGTGDDYKNGLTERTQFLHSIEDCRNIITPIKEFKQYPMWSIGEILSEIFAMNPPLMSRYQPEIIEKSYKLKADKSIEYMYGRRWQEWNQVLNIIETLSTRQDSKRAVIDIFTPYDTDTNRIDVPCTLLYTFKIRNNKLNMTTAFRSHDLFSGFKYDLILSSFVNQLITMGVNCKSENKIQPGNLTSYEDSLHIYPRDYQKLIDIKSQKIPTEFKKFNLMYDYKKLEDIFSDLWKVVQAEESSYYGNFEYSMQKIEKIQNPAFKDFAKVYYNRNLKFNKSEKTKLNYDTDIMYW